MDARASVEEKDEHHRIWFVVPSAILLVTAVALSWLGPGGFLVDFFSGLALAISAAPVLWEALERIRANPFNADFLMGIAAVSAALIGTWQEGAAVILLYNIAETIEDYTVDRARGIAKKTAALLPQRALVKKGSELVETPVDNVKIGDVIVVKPGWRIPIDGQVVGGGSTVDQSAVTGESIPVEKTIGENVLSGTLNLEGSMDVKVEKPFSDSTISRVVKLVTEAHERKAKIEGVVDRFARFYTPSMILLAALVALVPTLAFGQAFSTWIYRALIVLVIACPSAFVIATPVTVLIGLTRAMWSGILVKGGLYLEEIARVRSFAFDKTGTLTVGKFKVTSVEAFNGFEKKEVLHLAAIAESKSTHPIGIPILEEAERAGLNPSQEAQVQDIPGKGLIAVTADHKILVGKQSFLEENGIDVRTAIDRQGSTSVAVAVDGRMAGIITVADYRRPEASTIVASLKELGIQNISMLTGDNEAIAEKITKELGLMGYYAELLPEDKVRIVRELRQKYGSVAVVGDGVNDAPALAASNVGIAIGTAGNDIAIEAADVALMGSDLTTIPYLVRLGRKVVRKLKVNIAVALGAKALMIMLGTLGVIPLWFSVVGDDGITIVIIANALPLLRFKR